MPQKPGDVGGCGLRRRTTVRSHLTQLRPCREQKWFKTSRPLHTPAQSAQRQRLSLPRLLPPQVSSPKRSVPPHMGRGQGEQDLERSARKGPGGRNGMTDDRGPQGRLRMQDVSFIASHQGPVQFLVPRVRRDTVDFTSTRIPRATSTISASFMQYTVLAVASLKGRRDARMGTHGSQVSREGRT